MTPRFSLVIPAYNEEAYLPSLLDTVDAARAAYSGGADAIEVIVADNASTDRTSAIALTSGCRVAHDEKRIIGAARNAGARVARGEFVCFVDADMRIHPQTFNAIEEALASGCYVGGSTGALPERWSAGLVATFALVMLLVTVTRMDTGVVFCRRDDYDAVGGYREDVLYAEDLAFLGALWRLGVRRWQRLARVTRARAIVSTRKFDKYGDWHIFTLGPQLLVSGWRASTHRWAQKYWYEDR